MKLPSSASVCVSTARSKNPLRDVLERCDSVTLALRCSAPPAIATLSIMSTAKPPSLVSASFGRCLPAGRPQEPAISGYAALSCSCSSVVAPDQSLPRPCQQPTRTRLTHQHQQGKIKSLESIYLFSMPVKEYQVCVCVG